MQTNVDPSELRKFSDMAARWWDPQGPMRPLHEINPARLVWIDRLARLAGKRVLDVGCGAGVLAEAMAEVVAVAKASGVSLDADIISKTLAFIDASAPDIRPSMQRDLEAGRMSELESLIGVVVRLGRERGVPTPVMRLAYALLKPAHLKASGKV